MLRQMRRSRRCPAAFAVTALLAIGCGSYEPPLAPTPVRVPVPPAAAPAPEVEYWSLEETMLSVTNGEMCGWNGRVGALVSWPLTVRRTGTVVQFVYGDVVDQLELVGSVEGEAFTASGSAPIHVPCLGQGRDYILESNVEGRFSANGSALAAKATLTYRLASGEAIVFTFDWVATRR